MVYKDTFFLFEKVFMAETAKKLRDKNNRNNNIKAVYSCLLWRKKYRAENG